MLYEYCQHKGVPHKQIGKLIVATSSQQKRKILEIMTRAHTSGVRDLCLLSKADVAELEPAVQCSMALLSPSTGIVDSHSYMQALLADFEAAGGTLALNTSFVSGSITDSGRKQLLLEDTGSGEQMAVECDTLVNAAGLWAQAVAAQLQGLQADSIPAQHLAKGNYFTLSGELWCWCSAAQCHSACQASARPSAALALCTGTLPRVKRTYPFCTFSRCRMKVWPDAAVSAVVSMLVLLTACWCCWCACLQARHPSAAWCTPYQRTAA